MSLEQQRQIIREAIRDRTDNNIPLTCMTFALTDFNDEGLELFLQEGIQVEELYLMRTQVTDAGMALLNHFPNLKKLDISSTPVTTDGLRKIERKDGLRSLNLDLDSVVEGGFATISEFSGLESLGITASYADSFFHYHRKPADFSLIGELPRLGNLTNLRQLGLRGVPLQGDSLDWLADLTMLESITLSSTDAKPSALARLADFPYLASLWLSNTGLNDATLMHLANHLPIKDLGLANTAVTDKAVHYLASRVPLESIFAEEVDWSPEACEALLMIPTLEHAELNIDGVEHEFLEKVAKRQGKLWLHP